MKKLSKINEGTVWGGAIKRSITGETRREDKMKFVDLGLSVLWAEEDLNINGKDEFTWEEIHDYNKNGYRLPTRKECLELFDEYENSEGVPVEGEKISTRSNVVLMYNNGNTITLTCGNHSYKCEYWESDKEDWDLEDGSLVENGCYFEIQKSGSFYPRSAYCRSDLKKNEKKKVRLVKRKGS